MSTTSNCGTQQQLYSQDSTTISEILKLHSIPKDPLRIFEIYDTQSRQLIISCPSCLYTTNHLDEDTTLLIQSATELAHTITLREMDKRTQQQQQPKEQARITTCTHYSHSNTTAILQPHGLCRIETIIITYGSLTFSTYQITPMMIENNNALHHSTNNNTCSYHHYIRCDPVIDSDRP